MNANRVWLMVAAAMCLFGAACGDDQASGPPEVRYGRDECAECKMGIWEEKFACGLRVRGSEGVETLLFDDVGCMLDYEEDHPAAAVVERYVHDMESKKWVAAASASFVLSDQIQPPMASEIGALTDEAAAKAAQDKLGGRVLTYQELVKVRPEWKETRYGKPNR